MLNVSFVHLGPNNMLDVIEIGCKISKKLEIRMFEKEKTKSSEGKRRKAVRVSLLRKTSK